MKASDQQDSMCLYRSTLMFAYGEGPVPGWNRQSRGRRRPWRGFLVSVSGPEGLREKLVYEISNCFEFF
jgi:hypothetical protein